MFVALPQPSYLKVASRQCVWLLSFCTVLLQHNIYIFEQVVLSTQQQLTFFFVADAVHSLPYSAISFPLFAYNMSRCVNVSSGQIEFHCIYIHMCICISIYVYICVCMCVLNITAFYIAAYTYMQAIIINYIFFIVCPLQYGNLHVFVSNSNTSTFCSQTAEIVIIFNILEALLFCPLKAEASTFFTRLHADIVILHIIHICNIIR